MLLRYNNMVKIRQKRGIFMEQVSLRDLYKSPEEFGGKEIKLSGWVKTARDSKTFGL